MSIETQRTGEALEYVRSLSHFSVENDVPCMQAANSALKYETNYDTNNEDSKGFRLVQAIYKEEAQVHGEFHNLLQQGKEYVIMLYTWRSYSRALPTVSGTNVDLNNCIQEKTIEILKEPIEKLKRFRTFQEEAVEKFCKEVEKLCQRRSRDEFLSEDYMLAMCQMLKMFTLLDEMKNMKASMKNDNTHYRRAAQHLKLGDAMAGTETAMYLAQQNIIRMDLKKRLEKIAHFEEFFLELINLCVTMYNERLYIFPEEKHTLVLVIAFSLYLMDPNLNKMKKVPVSKIDVIFKECEVVNVFGDMSIHPFSFIQNCSNFDSSKWPENSSSKTSAQGNLLAHMTKFRSEYTSLTVELARYSNDNVRIQAEDTKENLKAAYDLALKSLQLVSKWTTQIIDTFSWKLGNLANPIMDSSVPKDAEDYEKATRYNYNSEEKFALIEVIAMIKSVQNQLSRLSSHFSETINPHIYVQLQEFLHVYLPEIYHKISKKTTRTSMIIQTIWAVGLDPVALSDHVGLLAKSKNVKGRKANLELLNYMETMKENIQPRQVPPGSTQLYLIRCIVESLFKGRSAYKKELDNNSIVALENFHRKSFYWSYLLNFGNTLEVCCDLSQLWYREFFLEMTNGTRIQFPIETSIPCILTNHILDTQNQAYMEYLLYPLDLYNDSAICALKKFKRQFLYNEIEAEVNFMMIQLILRLSDQIFLYYKQQASIMILNKQFKREAEHFLKKPITPLPVGRYVTLMKQRHLQLLGRTFNLSKLISQNINNSIYTSLETTVKRFRKNGLTFIIEFDTLIEINRLCYKQLQQYLDLDDFDSMFKEITHSTASKFGTVTAFIVSEICDVLCPNYAYSSSSDRFIAINNVNRTIGKELITTDRHEHVWGNKALNTCFDFIFKLYRNYFGKEHMIKMCDIIGYDGVFAVITRMTRYSESILKNEIQHYVTHLMDLMPTELSSRLEGKSASEQKRILQDNCEELFAVNNITTDLAQSFRKFGNSVLFILKLENNMFIQEGFDKKQAFPFITMFPKVYISKDTSQDDKRKKQINFEAKYQVYNIINMVDKFGTAEQVEICREQLSLTKERLCEEFSIFKSFLMTLIECLQGMTDKDDYSNKINFWTRKVVDSICVSPDYHDKAFYMIWSIIIYIFSNPKNSVETFNANFGEGVYWAGCIILALCGQQRVFDWHNICGKLIRGYIMNKKEQKVDMELDKTVIRIRDVLQTNVRIFDVINRYIGVTDNYDYVKPMINHFNPAAETESDGDDSEFED